MRSIKSVLAGLACVVVCGLGASSVAGEAVLFSDGRYLEVESYELSIIDGSILLNVAGGTIWVQKSTVKRIESDQGVAWQNVAYAAQEKIARSRRAERARVASRPVAATPTTTHQILLSAWADDEPIIRRAGR